MRDGEIALRNGIQVNVDIGSLSSFNAARLPDGTEEVYLSVSNDEERECTLRVGETFPVRDQIWRLDDVVNAGSADWNIVLRRVEHVNEPGQVD